MTPRGRVDRGTALLITAILLQPLPKCTPFSVRWPCLHRKVPFLLGQGAATAFNAKKDTHHIRCSAVALAVSGNSVFQAADDDSPSTATTGASSSAGAPGQHAIVHRADSDTAAASAEVEEKTVVGEIVLSDWLEELPLASLTLPGAGQRSREGERDQQGLVEVVSSQQHGQHEGRGEEQGEGYGDDISAPFRFQQLIQVTYRFVGGGLVASSNLLKQYREWNVGNRPAIRPVALSHASVLVHHVHDHTFIMKPVRSTGQMSRYDSTYQVLVFECFNVHVVV